LSSDVVELLSSDVVELLSSNVVEDELPLSSVVTVPSSRLVLEEPLALLEELESSTVTDESVLPTSEVEDLESPLAHATPTTNNAAVIAVKTPIIFLYIATSLNGM
jgi:hypothetical protein